MAAVNNINASDVSRYVTAEENGPGVSSVLKISGEVRFPCALIYPYIHPHLFPLSIRPGSILQLQGETRLRLADDKNLKTEEQTIKIQRATKPQTFPLDVQSMEST